MCFLKNESGVDLSPSNRIKLLYHFPGIDQITRLRTRSITSPDNKHLQSTALQLMELGIIELSTSIEAPNAFFCLSINEQASSPAYLDSNH